MKKQLIASALIGLFSTTANAGFYLEAYANGIKSEAGTVYGGVVGYDFGQGSAIEVEYDSNKDLEFTVGHKLQLNEVFYIKPSASYVKVSGEKSADWLRFDTAEISEEIGDPGQMSVTENGLNSDVYKLALEAGFKTQSGVFGSLRYRHEVSRDNSTINAKGAYVIERSGVDDGMAGLEYNTFDTGIDYGRGTIGRTDLALGYDFSGIAAVQGKAINKRQLNNDHADRNTTDYELRLTYTAGFAGIQPYAEYKNVELSAKRDHMAKFGVKYAF